MTDYEFDGFEWDEAKSAFTLARRGIDFIAATEIFQYFFTEREDLRHNYEERCFIATGCVDEFIITVVWTPRGSNRHIITVWPASDQEKRAYYEHPAIYERTTP